MMNNRARTGKVGEEYARNLLQEKGYQILEQNWRYKHLELDLIGQHQGKLVFIEVKTRRTEQNGLPFESVNVKKQRCLGRAALAYMSHTHYFGEIRFDIVSIILTDSYVPKSIEIIQDAFWFQ